MLFVIDIGAILFLGYQLPFYKLTNSWHAYTDSDTLSRFEVPIIGQIASNWTDSE